MLQLPRDAVLKQLPFSLSFSKIQEFAQCQEKFWQNHLYKTIKFVETPEIKAGKDKHYWLENYGRTATPETRHGWRMDLTVEEMDFLDKVKSIPNAIVLFETDSNFGFTDISFTQVHRMNKIWDKQPNGDKYYLTGLSDLTIITGESAVIIDYKNKKHPDKAWETMPTPFNRVQSGVLQLEIYAVMIFLLYPEVKRVKTQFRWLKSNSYTDHIYLREDLPSIQKRLTLICQHIEYAHYLHTTDHGRVDLDYIQYRGTLPASSPSPLCGWCGYKDRCEDYKKSKFNKG